ncbi:hypothetical protein FRC11_005011, partial [Ceratobasidium sp. 423]
DSESIAAGIVAFGGQWRDALTNDITHLFCLTSNGPKYAKALSGQGHPLQIQVVVPHWFFDCFKTETLLSTKNYLFPDPLVLSAGFNERMMVEGAPDDIADDPKVLAQRRLLCAAVAMDLDPSSNSGTQPSSSNKSTFSNRVLGGKRVVFSARAVQSDPNRDQVYRRRVEQVGGIYISGLSLGGDGVSQAVLEDADVFITSYRGNEEYDLATRCNVIIGTPAWILYVTSMGLWSAPKEHLLHYPYPEETVPGFEDQQITITNYVGDAREYLKKLIAALGGKFTPSLNAKNTCVIASHIAIPPEQSKQNKISKAREWRIPIVNHLWLEDCFREWAKLPVSDQKYLNFPQGHDWTQEINARGIGNGPVPNAPPPRDKKPEVHQNGHSVRAASVNAEADGVSRPMSPSKPASTLRSTPAPKPRSISKPASSRQNPSASKQAKNGAPLTDDTPHTSPSKPVKVETMKRKNDADISQSTKRPKTTQPASAKKNTGSSPAKSTGRPPSEAVSPAPSSSFVKPLSEVPHRGPIKLLSPDKGKRKSRKASSDDEGSNHDSDSSSSSEPPTRQKPSPPSMSTGGRKQRAAATAAQDILRNVIMPDVQKFQNEMSSSKGDVRKMEQLAEKKQRRSSIAHLDNDDEPASKKKKVQGDDDNKSKKSQALKSSQSKNDSKKESEKSKSASTSKHKSKPSEDEKPRKSISNSSVRIVCSKSKPTEGEIKQMERLGAKFTEDDPSQCTHLVVNSISRTEKFLCAFPVCSHVVTMNWLQDSIKEGKLQDESQYQLSDPDNEKRYGMTLSKSLRRIKANNGKLLAGHTFFVTDKVGVEFKSMQRVIESSGGVAKLEPKPTKKKIGNDMKHNHVISSQEAKPSWQALIKEDIPIYSKEFILNGILRQDLNWAADRIH